MIVRSVNNLNEDAIKLLLAFSGAYLFAISVFHLIPEVYSGKTKNIGIFLLIGFILQIILEFFSKGIEHGHGHIKSKTIPTSMLISLAIHAYLEGMPLGGIHVHGHVHENFEYSLLSAIALHKIPVTIVLMSLFTQAKFSTLKSIVLISFFAIMAPLGILTGNLVQDIGHYHKEIMAVIVGIFLHISTTILFENSEGHKFNIRKLVAIGIASCLAWFL
jgi:zinc transporter ZupT